jgi:hypothetical protein
MLQRRNEGFSKIITGSLGQKRHMGGPWHLFDSAASKYISANTKNDGQIITGFNPT